MNKYFLNTKENNIIKLFIYILKYPQEKYENSELSNKLRVSPSYLQLIYKEFETIQKKYNKFSYEITSKYLIIELNKNFSLTTLYHIFFKSSLNYKLLNSLYFGTFHTLIYFAQDVNYSIRTVQRSAQNLQLFLKHYNISLNLKKKKRWWEKSIVLDSSLNVCNGNSLKKRSSLPS